ncbi:acetyl-CoA hydrolase/transferase C-terminal domain-containing protein [Oceanicola sp. 22II-s10i]|uniref:acetyl-CoA hydrolase/transferase C-terminal domain-containing protein n=1 Tax=Oceanicola sp. 22II-s10i TaxID=1317116 RepID=UPI0020CF8E63|nr:acetyl-CoA hydrolase/transferase C-terminal domain-containing protein [Oceanicola sp. 22II-s10i]
MTRTVARPDAIAAEIIERTGGEIRLALPLGLGKPVTLVNALTRMAAASPDISLSIVTALTLERPDMSGDMARRFLEPAADRLFGTYPALDYARMLRDGTLPANIEVAEFFMQAGRWLKVPLMQRHYMPANYTHAFERLRDWNPNVVMQLLAPLPDGGFSLSCNTDISSDLIRERRAGEMEFLLVGETNARLPAMDGPEARIAAGEVDLLHDDGPGFDLFSVPKRPVGLTEHAIGLHVARTIRDGGTLQIGIGAIGDAVAHALMLRHAGKAAEVHAVTPFATDGFSESGAFDTGLYAVTEMLVDGILRLFEAGIVRREVDGAAIHAGFFVDCRDFYHRLAALPEADRRRIRMMPVSFTNQLYGDEPAKRAARRDARFVNAAMKATLLGGLVSDVTSGGQEVSGIGGQFNFIEQAFALRGARSVITLPATRTRAGKTGSNIVWSHPHESVPRQYRDVVVTEYGIADLRGRRDEDAVAAMLRITDSRFQGDLLEQAKSAGKISRDFRIPDAWQRNTPETLRDWLGPFDLPDFPFGTDFDDVERQLLPALDHLSEVEGSRTALAGLVLRGLRDGASRDAALARMGLDAPDTMRDRLSAWALRGALARQR